MATRYVGAATAAANSISIPSHSAGNVIIVFAVNRGSTTLPTVPTGWKTLRTRTGSVMASVVAYCIASSAATVSGTWTNATHLAVWVGDDDAGVIVFPALISANNLSSSTNITYSASGGFASAIYVGFAGLNNTTTDGENAPSGMTNRSSASGSSGEITVHDTIPAGEATSWPTTSYVASGLVNSHTAVIEILNSSYAPSASGGLSPQLVNSQALVRGIVI